MSNMPQPPYPISNYGQLKQAVQLWMDRDDDEFVNQIPNFIDYAQKTIYTNLRTQPMEKEVYLGIVDGICEVPTDYLQGKYMYQVGGDKLVRESSIEEVMHLNHFKYNDRVDEDAEIVMAIMGPRMIFAPKISVDIPLLNKEFQYELTGKEIVFGYYFDPQKMTQDSDTNPMLTLHPELFLYEACVHACTFTMDTARMSNFQQFAKNAYDQINTQTERMTFATSPAVVPMARPHRFF